MAGAQTYTYTFTATDTTTDIVIQDVTPNGDTVNGSSDVALTNPSLSIVDMGADGNDVIDGDDGDDLIYGGGGDDNIWGGADADTIVLEDNFGNDTLGGGEAGVDDDTLDLSAITTDTTVDLTNVDPENGTVSDGTSTASFVDIENIVLGGGRDTIVLADGSGDDTVQAFDMTDSGDGTTNDQLDVSGMTDANGAPVNTGDVTVTDTNGDGTGDAILTFPGGESITLVGVLSNAVSTPTQLASLGIPAPDFIVEGTAGNDTIDGSYLGDPEGDMVDAGDATDGLSYGFGRLPRGWKPLPATPFMAGSGGGWIVNGWVFSRTVLEFDRPPSSPWA